MKNNAGESSRVEQNVGAVIGVKNETNAAQINQKQSFSSNNVISKSRPKKLLSERATTSFEKINALRLRPRDIICLSHLRWDFVYQRPQHLLSRGAAEGRVFFVEEPIFDEGPIRLELRRREGHVWVAIPHLPAGAISEAATEAVLEALIDGLVNEHHLKDYVLWYYTPMALGWTRQLNPLAVVYDCMDELSAFKNAPVALREKEAELFSRADVVFTGGQSLYEAKRHQHSSVYAFPSSVDTAHFASARNDTEDPADQAGIPHPRIGFYGVIDERFDIKLLKSVAETRPQWHWVLVGPIVKIDPVDLPKLENVHYLGSKSYKELPAYLAGWDVAMMPFARNESTRFISPTKTPEYLAAGKPVVSTSIRDVVRPYQELGLARIADTPKEFINAIEAALGEDAAERMRLVDKFLAQNSWDRTWREMSQLIDGAVKTRMEAAQAVKQSAMRVAATAGAASFVTGD